MIRLDERATNREELMTVTVQTVHTSWVSAPSVHRTLKQAIICFLGHTVPGSIKCFLKVNVLVGEIQVTDYSVSA